MAPTKKQKTEDGAKSFESEIDLPPPPYGSRTYWENRYRKHCFKASDSTQVYQQSCQENGDANLCHSWYFTFDELRPLILPILFGGSYKDPNQNDLNEQTVEDKKVRQVVQGADDSVAKKPAESTESSGLGINDDDEWVEVDDGQSSDGSDSKEGVEREGFCKNKYGPISVLEIGCGDVPLGAALADELNDPLQKTTGALPECVFQRIVCLDFSETVISILKKKQEHMDRRNNNVTLEYVAADARSLNYPNSSFHLIFEKGTLDSMLSDTESGASSSTLIMKQCARTLIVGGYILLVSHLNAYLEKGRQWLEEVVIPGLRSGDANASWEIEVHGSQGAPADEEEGDDDEEDKEATAEEEDDVDQEGPGPAVYIIHKLPPRPGETTELSTVPLNFIQY